MGADFLGRQKAEEQRELFFSAAPVEAIDDIENVHSVSEILGVLLDLVAGFQDLAGRPPGT